MTDAAPAGRLNKPVIPSRPVALRDVSLAELSSELLARIQEGAFTANEATILLGTQIHAALQGALDVHNNRASRQRYRDLFIALSTQVGPHLLKLDGATIVDVGCGPINPYGMLFLFLMLGARRGIAIDLDPIQDEARAIRALAECAAMMLVDPGGVVGDYPIRQEEVLRNIVSFDLPRLQAGDPSGIDGARLSHRLESVCGLSIGDCEADLVISNSFLEHVGYVEEAIGELARITRIGGLGIHLIDGSDHRRYVDPACHPLEFLTEADNDVMVQCCNRIRPVDFARLFEQHGFEVIAIDQFERIEVNAKLRKRLAEPFRSMPDESLTVLAAQLVVRRHKGGEGSGGSLSTVSEAWSGRPTVNYVAEAWRLIGERRYAEALDMLLQTPEVHPQYYHSVAICGNIRRLMGDFEGAERDFTRAVDLTPRQPDAFIYRAWLRLDQDRAADGVTDALRAGELIRRGHPLEADLCSVLGLLYAKQGQHAEAMRLLDRLLQLQPDRAMTRVQRGWAFLIAGMRDRAVAEADAALAVDPNNAEVIKLKHAI